METDTRAARCRSHTRIGLPGPPPPRPDGPYVPEGDEHVDVLVERAVGTVAGEMVAFDEIWPRRQQVVLDGDVAVAIPCIDDLIRTKKFAARPRDADDIRWLLRLKETP